MSGRRYPHVAPPAAANVHGTVDPPVAARLGFHAGDVDAALATLGETLDIDRADLDRLLHAVETQALAREHGALTCGAVMSRDVIAVGPDEPAARARALLIEHDVRTVPVVDAAGRLAGAVGLRELALRGEATVAAAMSEARTAAVDDPAVALIAPLTDGRTHAVVVTEADGRVVGIVTQTDLLATLARLLSAKAWEPIGLPAA